MQLIDTHSHLYLNDFDVDRSDVVSQCLQCGVNKILLPNIDLDSISPMLSLCQEFKGICHPMLGLHPCEVKDDYKSVLQKMFETFYQHAYIAIGEVGIDLYWEQSFLSEQKDAFRFQIAFALSKQLPIIIHKRQSYYEVLNVLDEFKGETLKGIFHCYSGSLEHAQELISRGFHLGIGGTVTYKNSHLDEVLPYISLNDIVLETDAPFLPPVPYRGKRNQSSYLALIAQKIADIKGVSLEEVAEVTTKNAITLFQL